MAITFCSNARLPLRRSSAAIAATFVIACATASAGAAATTQAPPISVDGARVSVPALERNKQVFVPVRGVFEKLGANVLYSAPASIVASKHGKDIAHLTVGSRIATVNGVSQRLAAAPFAAMGHVMVPLRFISEAAGANVAYVASPRAVNITRAVAAAAAAPVVAAAGPVAGAAPVTDEQHGIPWWVWLLAALILIGIVVALMRRKKEPIITTSSSGRASDPNITTRR
jgi:hypothetical protein